MLRIGRCLITSAALLASAGAQAAEPFFFHKAAVEREQFVAEYMECEELASGVARPRQNAYSPNMYAMAIGSIFAGFMASRERRGNVESVLRICMADKGYRRVEVSRLTIRELNKLSPEARVDELFRLAASSEPQGRILPQ
jgi:hypothetical protein